MQTINLIVPDQYDVPKDQPFLLVSIPDHWKEFITEGHLESMLYDFSYVWECECESNSDYIQNIIFKLFIDIICDGYICRRVNDL